MSVKVLPAERQRANGKVPQRAYRRIQLQDGVFRCEVAIYSAMESPKSGRQLFVRAGEGFHEVGLTFYDKLTQDILDESEIVKGVKVAEDQVIEISDEEMDEIGFKRTISPILGYVERTPENMAWLEPNGSAYQIYPVVIRRRNETVRDAGLELNFAALIGGLRDNNTVALIESVFQEDGAKKFGYIAPNPFGGGGAILRLVYTSDELRPWQDHELVEVDPSSQKLMKQLILARRFTHVPELPDERSRALQLLIEQKLGEGTSQVIGTVRETISPEVGLEEALRLSIEALGGEVEGD